MNILDVQGVTLRFGGLVAIDNVSFSVRRGEIFGIIGPNGSGKTSLFNCINGIYRPQSGRILYRTEDGRTYDLVRTPTHRNVELGIARTFQNIRLFEYMTVVENILVGRHIFFRSGVLRCMLGLYKDEYIKNREIAEEIIDFLDLKAWRDRYVREVPLGIRKKVELARAIASSPKLLLLDEISSGLTQEEKSELLYYINEIRGRLGATILMIEHDVKVVSSVADRMMALDYGRKVAEGKPAEVLEDPRVVEIYLGRKPSGG